MDEDMKVFITSTDEDEDDDREEAFTVEQSQMIIKMATEQIDAGSNIVIESLTRYVEIWQELDTNKAHTRISTWKKK